MAGDEKCLVDVVVAFPEFYRRLDAASAARLATTCRAARTVFFSSCTRVRLRSGQAPLLSEGSIKKEREAFRKVLEKSKSKAIDLVLGGLATLLDRGCHPTEVELQCDYNLPASAIL